MAFSLCINLLMLTVPLYMLQIFDRVLMSRSVDTLLMLSLLAGAALLTLALLEAVRHHLFSRFSTWFEAELSGPLLRTSILRALGPGQTGVQGLRDLASVRSFLSGPTIFPLLDGPWTPVYLVVIYLLHSWLGWIAIGGAAALAVLAMLNELLVRRGQNFVSMGTISAMRQAETATRNADAVGAMGMMSNLLDRWQRKVYEIQSVQARLGSRAAAIVAISKFLRLTLQTGVLGTGAYLVVLGDITAGAMIAASILMGRALAPLDAAIGTWRSAVSARAAWRRLKAQLAGVRDVGHPVSLPVPKGRVEVRDLTYAFDGIEDPVLRNVRFELEPGEALAIIGPSGSGKTTLARLLVGNLIPRFGHVRLDGAEIGRWHASDRGQYVGFLPQNVELFGGTVHENISRLADVDSDAVLEASRLAGAHEMILRLPNGYETEIGEGGMALSGGQRQWIALARALYGGPKLVVLDEPNANLDHNGEMAFLAAMQALASAGATVVVIAHRPSILQHVDKVLVLRDGLVQAYGTRDEVLPKVIAARSNQNGPRPERQIHG
jgi:ATP-binding cassette subfamily B protein/ATP-binding cassette subfamily C protein